MLHCYTATLSFSEQGIQPVPSSLRRRQLSEAQCPGRSTQLLIANLEARDSQRPECMQSENYQKDILNIPESCFLNFSEGSFFVKHLGHTSSLDFIHFA